MKNILKTGMLLLALCFSSCYYDNLEELNAANIVPCTIPDSVSYTSDIAPILNASCGSSNSSCHSVEGPVNGFIALSNYVEVTNAIAAGEFMNSINHTGTAQPMPKGGGKLDECSINKIQKWIDQGALNN